MTQDPSSRATLKQIASELGVSASTVSRVLSGQARRYRISRDTEAAVTRLAEELKFSPNQLARGLRLNRTTTIGLIIPDIANPFFAAIAHQVAKEVNRRGYALILCDSQESEANEMLSMEVLCGRQVEGMIICPVGLSSRHLKPFERGSLPVVVVDRYFPDLEIPGVVSDNYQGGREGAAYLIEQGHRRIACIQGIRGTSPNEDRLKGYLKAMEDAGLPVDSSIVLGDSFLEQNGYTQTKLLLERRAEFTAIFAFSSLIGLGALRALREAGKRVPEDVSILAFDDQPYQAFMSPPMSTVAQSNEEMGRCAAGMLFDRIDGGSRSASDKIVLPTHLVLRASVAALAKR